ncbi:MerR family transcriptional regulator [Rhodococcus sp. Chr-9]|uniref:MerR family transcriptional regulator n=1 Tax=Rhodococcus sp. Chr-9 TaxID=713612 RepID=UPI00398C7107
MLTEVSARSLRYYEQRGLLSSTRTPGGQREYQVSAVDRVNRIQELYRAGLNSQTIYKILPCIQDADGGASATADDQLARDLNHEREKLRRRIAAQQQTLRALDKVIDTAARTIN